MLNQAILTLPGLNHSWVQKLFLVIGGSFLIALFARIAIPLPFSAVPIAVQGVVCLLLGALLGSRLGAAAVLTYIAQGALGLPVFALGKAGITILMGPTGGYLMGYVLGAWLTGYLIERSKTKSLRQAVFALTMGNMALYLCGLAQLSLFVGVNKVFLLGMLPFIPGDCFKLYAAYRVLKAFRVGL